MTPRPTPETERILNLIPGGCSCDPQAIADDLRPQLEQLETELQTMTALAERLAEALRSAQEKAKYVANEDNYLVPQFNPCELGAQIRDVSKEALAAYETHKKQTP